MINAENVNDLSGIGSNRFLFYRDACRYLDRFFDYRIALPPAKMLRYYQEIGLENGSWIYEAVCKSVVDTFSLGLRETEKFYRMAKIAAYTPTHNHSYSGFSDGNAIQFALCIIVPVILGLRMTDIQLYNAFITGNNPQPLLDVMGDRDIARGICSTLLGRNETYEEANDKQTTVKLSDKLRSAYTALFDDSSRTDWGETHIGSCSFSQQTKDVS